MCDYCFKGVDGNRWFILERTCDCLCDKQTCIVTGYRFFCTKSQHLIDTDYHMLKQLEKSDNLTENEKVYIQKVKERLSL